MYYSNTVIKPNINTNLSEIERIERKRLTGSYELPDPSEPYSVRAATYVRVSTGPQGESDKASLPTQRKETKEVIENNKWTLIGKYEDIHRTSKEESPNEREGLSQSLEDAKKGLFDVLVVWSDSRLGRNANETQLIRKMFRECGVQIYSTLKPLPIIDPRFFTSKIDTSRLWQEGVSDLSSAAESAEFAQKMQFGKMQVALAGKMPGRVPYGYYRKKKIILVNGKEKVISEIKADENKLAVEREIIDLYLKRGFGIRRICGVLNDKKIPGPKGGLWNYSTLRYHLKNPAYAGKVRWGWKLSEFRKSKQRLAKGHNGVIINGNHKKVEDETDFIKIQRKMEQRAQLGGRAVASKGLLVGLLKCSICGGNAYITSSPSIYAYKMEKLGRPKEGFSRIYYYVCSTVSKYGNSACKRYIGGQQKIEIQVVEEIRKLSKSLEAQKSFEKTLRETNNKNILVKEKAVKAELKKIPQIRDRFSKALGYKLMKFDEYGRQTNELNEKEEMLIIQDREIQKEKEENNKIQERVKKAISLFKNFDKIWDKASLEVRKDLLRTIIKKIVYSKNKVFIEYRM